jgi:hypothetical protein
MLTGGMEAYWDRAAREDPFHFVDSREQLGAPDVEAFWRGGDDVIGGLFAELQVELAGDEDVVEIGCGIGRLTRVLQAVQFGPRSRRLGGDARPGPRLQQT